MANLQKTTKPGFRHKNSCPDGWLHAGAKVPIRLTVRQEEYCRQAIDIHRFCYNLAVRTHRFCRRNRLLWPSWMDISKAFNACKREDYPFVTQVAAVVATGAFRDFGQAVDNWRNPRPPGPGPKNQAPDVHRHRLLPGGRQHEGDPLRRKAQGETPLPGQRQAGLHPAQGHLLRGQHQEGERPVVHLPEALETAGAQTGAVPQAGGIDTGINPLGTDSDGQTYRNPKASYEVQKNLRRWQRAQARRQKGSRGWWEAQRKIDKCHRRIRGLRHNAQHQMTSTVTRKFSELVIEDLNVAGLMRGNTPRAQADAGMGDIKRQLIYKGQWRHTEVILAPMWFPSSKTCSACGTINRNLKREPRWTCPHCGTRHDRNLNAAINLRNLIVPDELQADARGQEVVVPPAVIGAVNPRGRGAQAWKRGSPEADHAGDQPEEPDHGDAARGGRRFNKGRRLHARRTRHRERRGPSGNVDPLTGTNLARAS